MIFIYRNQNSHFANLPQANIQRSVMDRSFSHKTSFNTGQVIPIYFDPDILPGDTVSITTSKVVRLQTLLRPIFDDLYLDTYFFFVPYRLVWSHFKEFMGENTESAWIPQTEYSIPKITSPAGGFAVGTIADYLGLPVNVDFTDARLPSALPFRAYALIMNEFFRDQNLTDPLNIPTSDANQSGSNGSNYLSDVANGGMPFIAAKFFDYFTSCLPSPQKGSPVTLPIGDFSNTSLPVYSSDRNINSSRYYDFSESSVPFDNWHKALSCTFSSFDSISQTGTLGAPHSVGVDPNNSHALYTATNLDNPLVFPMNLWADASPISSVPSVSINDLRLAFAMQEFLELNARGGTRYIEILRSHFGVVSPDARLQRPEYLGGNRVRLDVSAVANHAQTSEDFLGDLGANSVTIDVHTDFQKSFTEHGILFGLAVVRYSHTYSQGMARSWMRTCREDFYWPVFANIGEQPVYQDEIYYQGNDNVFGYNEAWADYRYQPNRVSGELRPHVANTLDSWHLADDYVSAPTLSDGWIREDKSNVDRVLAVSSSAANQIFGDFYFKATYTRPMPMYSVPALLGRG